MAESSKALLLAGKSSAREVAALPLGIPISQAGFRVFSQWDEDGIIQYLIHKVAIEHTTFIEFGVESYEESNTRFLLLNDNWQGFVLDSSSKYIDGIRKDAIYWRHDLRAKCAFITRENINELISASGFPEDLGLLSIDIDGNDYWIWEALSAVRPRILICEYNSVFGLWPVSIPYQADFARTRAHFSNLYFGCSLGALCTLATKKGYSFVGSSIAGCNAFFVRNDVLSGLRSLTARDGYVESRFRESRDLAGSLTYLRGGERIRLIQDLPVIDVESGARITLRDCVEAKSK